ncbi:MAG: ATP-binding protein [Rhodoglobus sp.]
MVEVATHRMELSSPPDDINTVQDLMQDVWATAPNVEMIDRFSFETALVELAANVIAHADAGLGISCSLTVTIAPDRIEAELRDSGQPGGDLDLDNTEMPDGLCESGRGLPIIRALVDEFHYDRVGLVNRWKISRNLRS